MSDCRYICTSSSCLSSLRSFQKYNMMEKWKHTSSLYLSCQCIYLESYSYRQNAAAAMIRIEYKNNLFFYSWAMIERNNCNEHKNEGKFFLHTQKTSWKFFLLKFKCQLYFIQLWKNSLFSSIIILILSYYDHTQPYTLKYLI